jgi:hypothetical protein
MSTGKAAKSLPGDHLVLPKRHENQGLDVCTGELLKR